MEQATNQTGPYALNARRRVDECALEKEEEDYFNEDRYSCFNIVYSQLNATFDFWPSLM